jgi:hypothetical protein
MNPLTPDHEFEETTMNTSAAQPSIPGIDPQALERFVETLRAAAPQPSTEFQERLALRLSAKVAKRRGSLLKPLFRTPLRTAAAVVLTIVVASGAVLAVNSILRQMIGYDAGLNAVFNSDEGTQLNLSQTIGDYTLTLEWAYADSNRVTVAYTIGGWDKLPTQFPGFQHYQHDLELTEGGVLVPMTFGSTDDGQVVTSSVFTFNRSGMAPPDDGLLDLRFTANLSGWNVISTAEYDPRISNTETTPLDVSFAIDFTLPLEGSVRILDTAQSATDQNITVTLRRVMVTASQTRVVVCLVPPDPQRQWAMIPYLTTDGTEVPGGGGMDFITGVGEAAGEICNVFAYNAAMYDYQGEWSLEIRELVGFGSGGGNDQQRIAGSWRFDFVVP